MDRFKTFLTKFNALDLCKDEFILINVVLLFSSDRIGLFESSKINNYQEAYASILEKTMNSPEAKAKYNKNRLPVSFRSRLKCNALKAISYGSYPVGS